MLGRYIIIQVRIKVLGLCFFSCFVICILSKTFVQKQWQKAFEAFSKGNKIRLFCTRPLTYGYKSFIGIDINDQNPKKCLSFLKQSQTVPAWILLFLSSASILLLYVSVGTLGTQWMSHQAGLLTCPSFGNKFLFWWYCRRICATWDSIPSFLEAY